MKDSYIRQLDRDQRSRNFVTTTAKFAPGSRGAELGSQLDANITLAEQYAAKQDAATLDRQEATQQKKGAINTLLTLMRAINLIARSLEAQMPGIAEQFRMPGDSNQAVINRARAFIIAATAISAEFISRGLAATFLADLQAAIDAADEAENRQSSALAAQTAATADLAATLKTLRTIVRELDAIVRSTFADDPGTLAAWKSASTIEAAPQQTEEDQPPPPPPPAAQ